MGDLSSPHDNIDVRVNNKITIYGNVTLIGSISVASVGFLFLGIWITQHWPDAIMLSSILVYGFVSLLGLSALGLVAALWVKVVIQPAAGAYQRVVEARGQDIRNKLVHTQDNGVVLVTETGNLEVIPLVTIEQRDIFHHKPALPPAPEQEEHETKVQLPEYVSYDEIRSYVPPGHTLLGVGADDTIESRPFTVLDTLWIVGGSKTGKTNTAALKVEEGYSAGRIFIVVDPHQGKDDCLSFAIAGYADAFLCPVAKTREQIIEALSLFKQEADRRLAGGSWQEEWTLIIDEVGALTGRPGARTREQEEMYNLISPLAYQCGWQLRGFGMSGWFISQTAIGLAWLREIAMTVIVHKLIQENQQKAATNSNREIMRDMSNWPRGRVFIYGLDIQGELLLQQPYFTPRTTNVPSVPSLVRNGQEQPAEPKYIPVPPAPAVPDSEERQADFSKTITPEERERIINLAKIPIARRNICAALGKGKSYYSTIQRVLNEEGL